jgi:hypothetical protein
MVEKKGRDSKCQFDFRSLKIKNFPNLHACIRCAIYSWKFLDEGYNFALDLILIGNLQKKLWASKVAGV